MRDEKIGRAAYVRLFLEEKIAGCCRTPTGTARFWRICGSILCKQGLPIFAALLSKYIWPIFMRGGVVA